MLVPLLLALTALGVVALHRLLGGGQVVGGALAAAPDLSDLWTAARSDWQPGGLGAAAPSDPWLSLLAVLSAPLGGSVHAAVLALLLLALPLAALGGWAAAGAATRSRLLRAAAGVAWAGAAPLLAAAATGRLGALAAHLALPWVAVGLARATTATARRPALAAGALAGLAGAAAVCGAPVLLLPLLALVAVVALTARRWPGALLWTALPLLAAGGPLLAPALADPRVLLVGPGLPLATPAASSWRLLLADPGGALGDPLAGGLGGAAVLGVPVGALALAPGALLLVLALVGAARGGGVDGGRVARTAWWAVGLGLLAAVGAVRAGGWAGPGTSLVLAGLGAAALARAPRLLRAPADDAADLDDDDAWDDSDPDAVPAPRSARSRRPRTRWAALAAVLAVLAPLALVGAWTLQQSGGGLLERRPASAGDPAVAADAAASPDAVSTLHLSLADDGAATVTVRRGPLVVSSSSVVADLARGGSGAASARSATTAAAADAAVRSATALLAAGSDDPRAALAELGVGYVLLEPPAGSTAASATATARLDAVTGLARAGSTDAGVLYRVLPASGSSDDAADRPSRARLLDADGAVITALASRGQDVDAVVPAADPAQALLGGRTAVVAERSDPGWTARAGRSPPPRGHRRRVGPGRRGPRRRGPPRHHPHRRRVDGLGLDAGSGAAADRAARGPGARARAEAPVSAASAGRRAAALLSATGAAALVAAGLALGALPSTAAAPGAAAAEAGAAAAAAVDVPVPASGASLACPGGPVTAAGTGGSAAAARAAAAVSSATTGLVAAGSGASLSATALHERPSDDGTTSTDGTSTDGTSTDATGTTAGDTAAAPASVTGTALGGYLRATADPAAATTGTAAALAAGPVDGGAPLLAGATTSVASSGDLRGLVATACAAPAEDTWLVGGSTGVGRSTRLVLADTGAAATTVDVTVLTADGPQQPSSLQGLSLGAGEQRSVLLEGVLDGVLDAASGPGADGSGSPVAVRVRSSAGPVASWLVEGVLHGLVPGGQEVVGPAAAPATSLVVPGVVTAGPSPAVLRVANPGTEPVVARFSVVDATGSSVPSGATPATAVPPGSAVDVQLPSLPSGGVALAVDADGPVLAAARTDSAPSSGASPVAGDIAWTAAAEPLTGATLVALPRGTGRSGAGAVPDARLVLTSGKDAAAVDVAIVGADGRTGTARRVELPATTTTAADVDDLVRAAGGSGTPVAIVLTPVGGGRVVAALTTSLAVGSGGDLVAASPVSAGADLPRTVRVRVTAP